MDLLLYEWIGAQTTVQPRVCAPGVVDTLYQAYSNLPSQRDQVAGLPHAHYNIMPVERCQRRELKLQGMREKRAR